MLQRHDSDGVYYPTAKIITIHRDGTRRFIHKNDVKLLHDWMLDKSTFAKVHIRPGIKFCGAAAWQTQAHSLVERWIKTECPAEADWNSERGWFSMLELGRFYAAHEELWQMLPVALQRYFFTELGLISERHNGSRENGYGPQNFNNAMRFWPEPEDGFTPVFEAKIIEAGYGVWPHDAPNKLDAPGLTKAIHSVGKMADALGVKTWYELDMICTLDGLRVKRKGGVGQGRLLSWETLGLGKSKGAQKLLMELAMSNADGVGHAGDNARRVMVSKMNKKLAHVFGIEEYPLQNSAGRTKAQFMISWEGPHR